MEWQYQVAGLIAAVDERYHGLELVILIVLPLFLTFLLWKFAKSRVQRGAARALLWSVLLPLVAAVYLGLGPLKAINSDFYREWQGITPRSEMLHYAAFFVPIAAILFVSGLILHTNYREKMER